MPTLLEGHRRAGRHDVHDQAHSALLEALRLLVLRGLAQGHSVVNLPHTKKALELWAHEQVLLDQQVRATRTNADVRAWQAADKAADDRVREAFYQDCLEQGIPNSRDHCMLVDMKTLRRWCK